MLLILHSIHFFFLLGIKYIVFTFNFRMLNIFYSDSRKFVKLNINDMKLNIAYRKKYCKKINTDVCFFVSYLH